jgi:outer membrane receptor protein involved in Fe transport
MPSGGEPVSGPAIDSERARPIARLLACCALASLLGSWACITRADTTLSADIPPQAMADALAEFAHQTRLQFVYVSKIVKARVSPGAHAGQTAAEALPLLLGGTGLDFAFLNTRTVRIFESGTAAPAAQANETDAPKTRFNRREPLTIGPDEVLVRGLRISDELNNAEDVQSIAGSVSMVSGDILEERKLEQLSDYAALLPGISVAGFGSPGSASILLRGVPTFTEAASASYYLDDTPLGVSGNYGNAGNVALDIMPYDLEQLEVRRGPQGTHYGADSATGAVRFALKAPSFSRLEARVGADGSVIHGAANPGGSIRGMLNLPVVPEVLAVRISAYDSHTPGYIDNAYNGARDVNPVSQTGERIALLWRPATSLSIEVTGFWPRIHADSEADVSSTGVAIVPGTGDAYILRATGSYGDLTDHHAFLQPFTKSIDYYAATLHWNPGAIAVVSATAWSRTDSHKILDQTLANNINPGLPFSPAILSTFHRNIGVEKFSEELRIVSPHGRRYEWLLGGFYTHESVSDIWTLYAFDNNYQPIAALAPAAGLTTVHNTFTELASFGELTWHVNERFDLMGGVRYAHNDLAFTAIDSGVIDMPAHFEGDSSKGVATWMSAASYHVAPQVMFYGRVATGSQPGYHNGGVLGAPLTVNPETVTNYEVGVKSEYLDHTVLADLALYYIDLKDVQLGDFFEGGWGGISGGNVVSQGVELTTSYSPVGGLKLALGGAYMQSELTSLAPGTWAQSWLPGYQLPYVPRWSYTFTTDYDWALSDLWYAHAGAALRWVGARWSGEGVRSVSIGGAPTMEVPAYTLLDLNASIAKGPMVLRVFARNVTDSRAISQALILGDPTTPPAEAEQRILQPRTIGIGFDYAF